MDKLRQERITRFLNDPTSKEVYDIIFGFFVKNHGEKDVYMLAARALAADLLPKAWLELEHYRLQDKEADKPNPTPHV